MSSRPVLDIDTSPQPRSIDAHRSRKSAPDMELPRDSRRLPTEQHSDLFAAQQIVHVLTGSHTASMTVAQRPNGTSRESLRHTLGVALAYRTRVLGIRLSEVTPICRCRGVRR